MPEGDTVFLAATRLRAALVGQELLATEFRLPRLATADLSGQTVLEVLPRGKHLFLRTDAGISLHTHFQLQGAWHLYRPGQPWAPPAHDVRVVLRTEPWVAVGYRLPVCELLPTARDQDVVAHLGPDPLGPDWDPDEAVRRLLLDPDRAVGTAILDQSAIAGPGNVYKNEVLFLRGVDPWTKVGHVRDLRGTVDLVARLMGANRTTGNQITTGDTRPGRDRWVHGRAGKPCRRCGTLIASGRQVSYDAERQTFYCERCQPAAPDAAAVEGRPPAGRTRGGPVRRGRPPGRR
jgi:formamidopyrimidine-DNA glycosylase